MPGTLWLGIQIVYLRVDGWVERNLATSCSSPPRVSLHPLSQNVFALIISASGSQGVPLPWVIPIWMVILFIEFFVCRGYDRFKHGKDVNSLWHLL